MSVPALHKFAVSHKIGIFADPPPPADFETRDGETLVIVSIGVGETHVSVLSDQARRRSHWTAVFGWSSLCDIPIRLEGGRMTLDGEDQIARALRGALRRYGDPVSTEEFRGLARDHLRSAIGYILDRTIGDGSGYDRIVISAPDWLHVAVEGCLDLRPHIWNEIQDK